MVFIYLFYHDWRQICFLLEWKRSLVEMILTILPNEIYANPNVQQHNNDYIGFKVLWHFSIY